MMATAYLKSLSDRAAETEVTHGACEFCRTSTLALDWAMWQWASCLTYVKQKGGTVYLVGNGGSASVVAHAQNDLVKAGQTRALVLQDVPLLTACANDLGYDQGLSRQLEIMIRSDDLLIAVSSSGASSNILRACDAARERRAEVITCSGFDRQNPLREKGWLNFYVPSFDYGQVELTHAALLHCLTDQVKAA